jgi:hypothetical protein
MVSKNRSSNGKLLALLCLVALRSVCSAHARRTTNTAFVVGSTINRTPNKVATCPIAIQVTKNQHHPLRMREHPTPVDDDAISQHELMMASSSDDTEESDLLETKNKPTTGGYRRIEDWHEEHKANEGEQVLAHLKQEKARWGKAFGTDGEGI